MTTHPVLLLAAHGTRSAEGAATLVELADAVRAARPELAVRLAFLDVREPRVTEAVAALDGPAVLVPALLSTGFHVKIDIPAIVSGRPEIRLARHLGPHPLLVDALLDRLREAGSRLNRRVLLVATGSSDPAARGEVETVAAALSARIGQPVRSAGLTEPIGELAGADVEIACYLLAGGVFAERVRAQSAPATIVSAPLGTHPAVVRLILDRYDDARCPPNPR